MADKVRDGRYFIFAAAVQAASFAKGIETQDKLAERAKLNRSTVMAVWNGTTVKNKREPLTTIRANTLRKITATLDMDHEAWQRWLLDPKGCAPNGQLLNGTVGKVSTALPQGSYDWQISIEPGAQTIVVKIGGGGKKPDINLTPMPDGVMKITITRHEGR